MPLGINRQASFSSLPQQTEIQITNKTKQIHPQRQISTENINQLVKPNNPLEKQLGVMMTGLSHLVEKQGNSLMGSTKEVEVKQGDELIIDTAVALHSRRGPNHELYDQVDKKSQPDYLWFKVLTLNKDEVASKELFVREHTFLTQDQEIVDSPSVKKSDDYRLRGMKQETYDYPCTLAHLEHAPEALQTIKNTIAEIKARDTGETPDVKGLIQEFREALSTHLGGTFISCLYGSYATGSQKKGSDIDVMFSCDNQTYKVYRNALVPILTDFLKVLHDKVGAREDDEVPPESKHLISAQELMEAASGRIYYPQGETQRPKIHTLSYFLDKDVALGEMKKSESGRFGEDFLASKYLRLRLIFNILTTPNDISSNNTEAVAHIQQVMRTNLIKLSDDLRTMQETANPQSVDHLLHDSQGNAGEMFLGYKADRKGVIEHLQRLIQQTESSDSLKINQLYDKLV
ncbi:nucleotidyltransferase domain-containing protein [Spartinivicinus poritis]|uniref:Nucleotidyltransferase domain-containing protein n=1 Tax=Spartinivicinus poritis TaxID=2994640 RepID=A0ABT5U392_9GAMM|nr:nucleotidyltransferase domain-containing protein [Spartinivicinus sp. A2-2]MDE1460837.1 nucleotidyltransferase domain-containing protein [Spartinivicinus sp. A2-2]